MSAATQEFVRMGEPGLVPRGLLKDAPAPRELFVARAEHAEKITSEDPIFGLIALHAEQWEFAGDEGLKDDELDRRMNAVNETWWKILDLGPCTMLGAAAYAEFVRRTEEAEECPTNRVAGDDDTHTNVCAVALARVAAFLKGLTP